MMARLPCNEQRLQEVTDQTNPVFAASILQELNYTVWFSCFFQVRKELKEKRENQVSVKEESKDPPAR